MSLKTIIWAASPQQTLIYGLGGNDILYGLSGMDLLDGGTGIDRMVGGRNMDVYRVDNVRDVCIESAERHIFEGKPVGDWVQSTVSYVLGPHIEHLFLRGPRALNGTGNAEDNQVHGNNLNNLLKGLAGDDILKGERGNDRLFGGIGNDGLDGASGTDRLFGEAGNDGLSGEGQ